MEVYDNFISIREELLRLAGPFGPAATPFGHVLLYFRNSAIRAGRWKAFGLDANNLRIKILGDRLHVIAINCGEELLERFSFGFHEWHFTAALGERLANRYDLTLPGSRKRRATQIDISR